MSTQDTARRTYRTTEVARMFGVTARTVQLWAERKQLRAERIGTVWLISREDIDSRLARLEGAA